MFNIPTTEAFKCFFYAIRFDLATASYVLLPVGLLTFIPFSLRFKKWYQSLILFFYAVALVFVLILDLTDVGFYEHNLKRTTFSIFNISTDVNNQLSTILLTHWYLFIIGIVLFLFVFYFVKKYIHSFSARRLAFIPQLLLFIAYAVFSIISMRGGLQHKPLSPIVAQKYTDSKYANLILNTPYTFLFSYNMHTLQPKLYFSESEVDSMIPLVKQYEKSPFPEFKNKNICIIIVESLGKESVGYYSGMKPSATPFLDSLIPHCLSFEHSYANGIHSNQGIVAINGIPSLMDDAFMASAYQNNYYEGIGTLLQTKNYANAFFHGAYNGSFNIDIFTRKCGFNSYFGKQQYNNDRDFDGSWGIFDRPFLQYTAHTMSTLQHPFCVGIFTLSSHHPFAIEKGYEQEFSKFTTPFLNTVAYTDYSLKKFFETAKKQAWFHNTLFVLCADHTSPEMNVQNWVRKYQIPILLYSGDSVLNQKYFAKKGNKLMQQIDILPTLMHIVGYDKPFFSWGKSYFDTSMNQFTVNYNDGIYRLIDTTYTLHFDGEKSIALYNHRIDPELTDNLLHTLTNEKNILENQLKAYIQQYNASLIHNKMHT